MLRKLIKVGTSAAVIVPQEFLKAEKIRVGDMVNVTVAKASKQKGAMPLSVDPEVIQWTNEFIEEYRPMLKRLASR